MMVCLRGAKMFSCLYCYDGLPEGEFIVNTPHAIMGPLRGCEAGVNWKGKEYTEPVLTSTQVFGYLPWHRSRVLRRAHSCWEKM
jgi:hypothetical protein